MEIMIDPLVSVQDMLASKFSTHKISPMNKWSFALLMLLCLVFPGEVSAQETPLIDILEIDLWPEYDRPEMLVIYRIELSPDTSLPVELSLQIPVEAGQPHAVAVRDPNGALLTAPYERSVEGDWAVITFLATMPGIQFEYYDPQIQVTGSQREYSFTWPGDYAVGSLSIQLQQPFDASRVETRPESTSVTPGSDGLNYHFIEVGPTPEKAPVNVNIQYEKASNALSIEGLPVQPVSPISSNISGRTNFTAYIPWGLGLLGVFLLTGGIYWYWRMGRPQQKTKSPRRGRRSSVSQNPSSPEVDGAIYCHQCGKRAAGGDRFCRSCGIKLRLK